MTDIEIAKQVNLENILDIAKKTNIDENDVELYGKYKAKISNFEKYNKNSKGKLVLVTAMSPTPLGEGKTTISIAIADGLNKIGEKAILTLREPSLGPVFGMKGGATGGGKAQIAPMEDINLHFTGDIHAITSANNLLSAMIDNHIYWGNELKIKTVEDSKTEVSHLLFSKHMNSAGRLFGGQLLMWIDEVAGIVARRHCEGNLTTACIDNLQFKEPCYENDVIVIIGYVTHVGRSSMEIRILYLLQHKLAHKIWYVQLLQP